jgi:hypothetical protein
MLPKSVEELFKPPYRYLGTASLDENPELYCDDYTSFLSFDEESSFLRHASLRQISSYFQSLIDFVREQKPLYKVIHSEEYYIMFDIEHDDIQIFEGKFFLDFSARLNSVRAMRTRYPSPPQIDKSEVSEEEYRRWQKEKYRYEVGITEKHDAEILALQEKTHSYSRYLSKLRRLSDIPTDVLILVEQKIYKERKKMEEQLPNSKTDRQRSIRTKLIQKSDQQLAVIGGIIYLRSVWLPF